MKKTILIICTLFSLISYSQKEYKIGVQLFREKQKTPPSSLTDEINRMGVTLDSIVAAITANNPSRLNSTNNNKVSLVVELDVPWDGTQLTEATGAIDATFDFEYYKQFASLCEARNIKWTPLLAPHYVPKFIMDKYSGIIRAGFVTHSDDRISLLPCPCPPETENGPVTYTQPELGGNPFLPFSPSSEVWSLEVASWIRAFVIEMRGNTNNNNENHFSLPSSSKSIDEILVGNEMMYPFNRGTSGDAKTISRWLATSTSTDPHTDSGLTIPLISDYPRTVNDFFSKWNGQVNQTNNSLRNFRNQQLAYCIAGMIYSVKDQLSLSLGINSNNIGVSSKLFSYFFPRTTNTSVTNEVSGYDEAQLGYIINESSKFIAIDSYSSPSFSIIDDFNAANSRVSYANAANPTNPKTIYVSEFNKNIGLAGNNTPLTATEIFNNGRKGFGLTSQDYNVRYYVFFAWNPTYNPAEPFYKITEGQQLGLYNLFNSISKITPQPNIASEEPKVGNSGVNNFPSGALEIPLASTSASVSVVDKSNLTISSGDVDWFKLIIGTNPNTQKTFYLKVVQQSNLLPIPSQPTIYGLNLGFSCTGILNAKTYKVQGGVEIDTKLFLYNADLVELASNDDYNGIKTFSKLYYNLNDVPPAFVSNLRQSNSETTDVSAYNMKSEVSNSNNKIESFDVLVSPNPAVNYLDVSVTGFSKKYNVLLTDLNGKTVYQEENVSESKKTIDVSTIKEGMYCLIVTSDNDKKVKKIIKLAK